jgi:hypothetical protein
VAAATDGLIFHALMYGPQAAFIAELFGTRVRYSGASMGYQVAGIFGGALAPNVNCGWVGKRADRPLRRSLASSRRYAP